MFWTGNQSEIQIQGQDGLMMERNLSEILSPPACLTLSHKGLTLEKPSPVVFFISRLIMSFMKRRKEEN